MPPRRRRDLAVPQKALLYDPELVRIILVSSARHVRGGEDFDLGSELMVGHKVGLSTDAEIPSDGLRRRDTFDRWRCEIVQRSPAKRVVACVGVGKWIINAVAKALCVEVNLALCAQSYASRGITPSNRGIKRYGRAGSKASSGRSRKHTSASGFASASVFRTSMPFTISRTASSEILPLLVRGISFTANTAEGT